MRNAISLKYAVSLMFTVLVCALPIRAQNTLMIDVAEGTVSIEADRVTLGRVLTELDTQAGTSSTVPQQFESRMVSVWVHEAPLESAIRKIFEGLALDYAVVGGNRIVVLAESKGGAPTALAPVQPRNSQPPPGLGTFQVPGGGNGNGDNGGGNTAPAGRGGRGRGGQGRGGRGAQLQQPAPGPVSLPTQQAGPTGRTATTPFGVPLNPAGGSFQPSQPFESILGNTSPMVLDLTTPLENAPPAPTPRPLPGMPASPPPATPPTSP